jgi:hypothetical protein
MSVTKMECMKQAASTDAYRNAHAENNALVIAAMIQEAHHR